MGLVFLKDSTLKSIGDAIRAKAGITAKMKPSQMAGVINSIETGDGTEIYPKEIYTQGGKAVLVDVSEPDDNGYKSLTIAEWMNTATSDIMSGKKAVTNDGIVTGTHVCKSVQELTADANAISTDIAEGKTAYVNGVKLTGNRPEVYDSKIYTQGGKSVPVTVSEPDENNKKSLTIDEWMNTATSDIVSGKKAVTNDGIVTGTHVCPTVSELTADADATAADIAEGKTAYVNGVKLTGEMVAGGGYEETEIAYTGFGSAGTLDIYHTLSNVDTFYLVCCSTSSNGLSNRITSLAKYDSSKCVYNYITSSGGGSVGIKGFSYTIDGEKVSISIPKGYSFYPSRIVVTG